MEIESPSFLGPCLKEAIKFQNRAQQLNGVNRLVNDGNGCVDFDRVFSQSLFGFIQTSNDGWNQIETGGLTGQERKLLSSWERERRAPRIMTIIDFDGVLVSPMHVLYNIGKSFVQGETRLADLPKITKEKGRVSNQNLRGLCEILKLSESTVIWTSRPSLTEFGKKRNLSIKTGKPIFFAENELFEMIQESNPEIVYYIGSSGHDRRTVVAFLKKHPELAEKLVFFDTCHREV